MGPGVCQCGVRRCSKAWETGEKAIPAQRKDAVTIAGGIVFYFDETACAKAIGRVRRKLKLRRCPLTDGRLRTFAVSAVSLSADIDVKSQRLSSFIAVIEVHL